MELRIFTEPQQGATYDDLLRVAQATEELGFDAFFRSDHYLTMGDGEGLPGPTDAWITLAGLARETSRIRLGTLVTSATFRHPGPLAISVAQIDQMSSGRVELGYGAGWFAAEHAAYGLTFPPVKERFDWLEEHLEVITGLWSTPVGERYAFDGEHVQISDSPALPKPVQQPVPIIIGGQGKRRTPALAARYASEFNVPFASLADTTRAYDRVRGACATRSRDASELVYSAAQVACCGRTEADVSRRASAIGREAGELRENGLAGTPAELVDKLGTFAEHGVQRLYLQMLDLHDLDHLEVIASDVLPHVG